MVSVMDFLERKRNLFFELMRQNPSSAGHITPLSERGFLSTNNKRVCIC